MILKSLDEKTGKGIAGVSFWYEISGPRRGWTGVQSSTGWVDNPKTNAAGELRAVVYPGKRRYGVGFTPLPAGYRTSRSAVRGIELDLPAGETVKAEFKLVPVDAERNP